MPIVWDRRLNILLNANHNPIIQVRLCKESSKFSTHCLNNDSAINCRINKVMPFCRKRKKYQWFSNSHRVKQVGSFLYVAIDFFSICTILHCLEMNELTAKSIPILNRFLTTKGIENVQHCFFMFDLRSVKSFRSTYHQYSRNNPLQI